MFKDALKGNQKQSTRRVTSVGTWASGKTTVLSCLGLTCENLSASDPKFKYWPDEKGSGIRLFWSNLRRGRFPPATPPGSYYESGFKLEWNGGFGSGTQTVDLPFCETSGEDCQKLIGTYALDPYHPTPISMQATKQLFEYILRSDGFILIAPISRALMFGDKGAESEPDDLPVDPDLNLARILDAIYKYREQTHSKPIKGMAILLTKYDKIIDDAKARGMDLRTNDGRQRFMTVYFPQTSANLKKFNIAVEYFPVFVQVETDDHGKPLVWGDGSGQKILVDQRRRLPVYSEQGYLDLIQWIKKTFAG